MKKMTAAIALFAVIGFAQATDTNTDEIRARTAKVGAVYLAGQEPAKAAEPTGPRSGEQVYQASCFGCHGTGAMGAPKAHTAEWEPRLAKGMDTLLNHAINGFNAMPPRGTCMNCSDDEIKAAIEFMTK